jgi:outer membrane protein OmpA-like peptidoglycan-associated protein
VVCNIQRFTLALCLLWAAPVCAAPDLSLKFPGQAEQTALRSEEMDSIQIATGAFKDGKLPALRAVGPLRQVAWRITMERPATLQLMQTLRDQVVAAGYRVIFECESDDCGGFDFRFATEILPEPEMHIDLGDFRYLAAQRQASLGKEYVTLVVSRSPQHGFVQLTQLGGTPETTRIASGETMATATAPVSIPAPTPSDLAARLDQGLPVVLEDLDFPSGSGTLEDQDYPSLTALAAWLAVHPTAMVTLVGHTDGSGGLAANVALSKQRAASVRELLLRRFKLPATQIASEGIGPLAPRSEDQTPEGRSKNRRVEVIVTSTQ